MLSGEMLLDAMVGAGELDVEKTAKAMGYLPGTGNRKILHTLLIAATLAALLSATALAAGMFGRAERLAPMPTSPQGEARAALIPNGFLGTPTYQGSAEWWAFMAQWEDTHDTMHADYELEFTKGDLDKYQICGLYRAYDEAQADKLYEIAEKYNLKLYKEQLHYDEYGGKQFYELTGCEPFAENQEDSRFCGYVFDDGSFKLESDLQLGENSVNYTLTRIRSGSIYPYGGAGLTGEGFREIQYTTKHGDTVLIELPSEKRYSDRAVITYVSPDGQTWLEAGIWDFSDAERDWLQVAKDLSDAMDFKALCVRNEKAKELLDVPTGAEDNRSTVEKLEAFKASSVMQAAGEFREFFRENFYGESFTGIYGMKGYEDIDRTLEALAEKYQLAYATKKTTGNAFYKNAAVYDNGAWNARFPMGEYGGEVLIHYIPKDALYTAAVPPLDISEYRRVWEYETEGGSTLLCYSEGPSVLYGAGAVMETEKAYIFLPFGGTQPQDLQAAAELVDWAGIANAEG